MRRLVLVLCSIVLSLCHAQSSPVLLRQPTVSKSEIVFTYAGDLWSVARDGGEAHRLTSALGTNMDAKFSPDGSMIAFTGRYAGNRDVYVMPAGGGQPRRLTYHPAADEVMGWTPDGKSVLFASTRHSYYRFNNQLNTVPATGGPATELPLPIAEEGSLSPDGTHLAYVPHGQWQPAWKHYRGGQTTPIWIADLKDSSIRKIPRENSNDFNPMWISGRSKYAKPSRATVSISSLPPPGPMPS
ncbi:MAG: PD40 domain-containing protein [Candidatus Koribacter versatilis]|nr:PD40 domain-containing protein [Candidatus Koribacter versatilis]